MILSSLMNENHYYKLDNNLQELLDFIYIKGEYNKSEYSIIIYYIYT